MATSTARDVTTDRPRWAWQAGEAGAPVRDLIGAAPVGDALEAAPWRARTLAERRAALAPGDVVLTGALGPFVDIAPGQRIRADLGPLGSITCAIERSSS